jgi:microcompartment protein CcmK/EutM
MVMITSDGGAVRELYGLENSPIRWAVLGLIDDEPEKPGRGGRT